MAKEPSIHYVYLNSYPVESTTERKEIEILKWIECTVIFVLRGPISLIAVSDLLVEGDGIIFDYEKKQQKDGIHLAALRKKTYVSPGIRAFILPEIDEFKYNHKVFQFVIDNNTRTHPTKKKNSSILELLIDYYSSLNYLQYSPPIYSYLRKLENCNIQSTT
ncbi:hypothetical protein ACM26V_14170 [Salipaludibacillus sp. HK11]|uniref:hypothetical protein n=1 Tax=Salipaludibacillus sp. HK11 TaxID=3394320 RepID=UPI0039FDBCA4